MHISYELNLRGDLDLGLDLGLERAHGACALVCVELLRVEPLRGGGGRGGGELALQTLRVAGDVRVPGLGVADLVRVGVRG